MVFISDPDIVEQCRPSPDEVDYIFSHPLRALLDGRPEAADADALAERDGEWWPHPEEFYVSRQAPRASVTDCNSPWKTARE